MGKCKYSTSGAKLFDEYIYNYIKCEKQKKKSIFEAA